MGQTQWQSLRVELVRLSHVKPRQAMLSHGHHVISYYGGFLKWGYPQVILF